ncbi:hypothetical protein OROMI_028606 [Orobanche minor]
MALANKDNHYPNESTMAIIQASAFYEHNYGNSTLCHNSSGSENIHGISMSSLENQHNNFYQELESPEKAKSGLANNSTMSNSSTVSSPSSTNSNGIGYQANTATRSLSEEDNSIISLKPDYGAASFMHASGSLLSFDQQSKTVPRSLSQKMIGEEDEYPLWEDYGLHHQSQVNAKFTTNHCPPETSRAQRIATGYGSPSGRVQFAWTSDQQANVITNGIQELGTQEASNHKRPSTGENVQALKQQCVIASNKSKSKSASISTSKDSTNVAAKNRRERISERLKVLQDLVPNGSKVDLVTMLEKAISYVKFLQLQVKVLATDEFWPAQTGKAPDLSQVREAIDAILASQRDRNSSPT